MTLEEQARVHFSEALISAGKPKNILLLEQISRLTALEEAGWKERSFSDAKGWTFVHPEFSGVVVWWNVLKGICKVRSFSDIERYYHALE